MGWMHCQNKRREVSEKAKKRGGCIKRRRPHLRWEDCLKRNLRNAAEEEHWREKAKDREQWEKVTKVVVHRSDN